MLVADSTLRLPEPGCATKMATVCFIEPNNSDVINLAFLVLVPTSATLKRLPT